MVMTTLVDARFESDYVIGRRRQRVGEAEVRCVSDWPVGLPDPPSRYIDAATARLGLLAGMHRDAQQARISAEQRGFLDVAAAYQWVTIPGRSRRVAGIETQLATMLGKALREHTLWPWLAEHPGLGGTFMARIISRIGDPRRFPGQQCTLGHTLAPGYAVGSVCPMTDKDGEHCPGSMLARRASTGTRSLWRYFGQDVEHGVPCPPGCDRQGEHGHSPRKRKGAKAHWDPRGRAALMAPDVGVMHQMVRQRMEPWYSTHYLPTKARLTMERGEVELKLASGRVAGLATSSEGRVDVAPAGDRTLGSALRPYQIEHRARVVAMKAMVGDLLAYWKRLAGAER